MADKLREDRVRRVVVPMLTGGADRGSYADRDRDVECKLLHGDLERTIEEGLAQTRGYMDRCGAEAGHLIVFDRAPDGTWPEKIFECVARPRRRPARSPSGACDAGRGDRVAGPLRTVRGCPPRSAFESIGGEARPWSCATRREGVAGPRAGWRCGCWRPTNA